MPEQGALTEFPIATGELDVSGPVLEVLLGRNLQLTGVDILRIRGASLTLTEGAADALNTAFGLDGVFTAGFPIGTARIYSWITMPHNPWPTKPGTSASS